MGVRDTAAAITARRRSERSLVPHSKGDGVRLSSASGAMLKTYTTVSTFLQ